MKCTPAECKKVAKEIYDMPIHELERQLIKCNKCFFDNDPATRYRDWPLPYRTRNAVGAFYALTFTHKRKN
ncbi:hypothetical protein [Hydrogenimonas sp.]